MRTIFTNGCFDIIHIGHIKLLKYCHKLAHEVPYGGQSKVVVGLNSDASVRRLKGDTRPINNEKDRMYILEALRYVDDVIIFDEDTPYENGLASAYGLSYGNLTPLLINAVKELSAEVETLKTKVAALEAA